MSDGANTPRKPEPDFSHVGPATLIAIHTGVKACDDALAKYEAVSSSRRLDPREARDRAEWHAARTALLTQEYPPPYKHGTAA